MGIKLPSYATPFSWLKKGCTTETPILKSISRHNQKNIGFVLTSWIFLSFLFFFTGILVPTTLWIFTQGYSPTWQIWSSCKMSEYLFLLILRLVWHNISNLNSKCKCATYTMSSEQDISCIIFSGKKKERGECITIQPKKSKTPKRLFYNTFWDFLNNITLWFGVIAIVTHLKRIFRSLSDHTWHFWPFKKYFLSKQCIS